MKQFKLLTIICMIFMPFMALADDENKTWEKAYKEKEEGTLFALKDPNVTADIVFDYTNCMVKGKTTLEGVDATESEMASIILETIPEAEEHFVKWYNQEHTEKGCSLVYNGSNSPYRIEVCFLNFYENTTKFLKTIRTVVIHGRINVYKNDDGTKIANKKFAVIPQPKGSGYAFKNDSSFDRYIVAGYERIANEFAEKIKKSKKPKEKKK